MTAITRRATTPAAPPGDWMANALCREIDPDMFYPEGRGGTITIATEEAKSVCNRCPVIDGCREWAVAAGEVFGVWGGLTGDELRNLRRRRTAQESKYALCIDQQELIERRVAEGASHREIGVELGVGHSSVGKACRFFAAERAGQAEAVNAA